MSAMSFSRWAMRCQSLRREGFFRMRRRLGCSNRFGGARPGVVMPLGVVGILAVIASGIVHFHGHRLRTAAMTVFHLSNGRYCYHQRDASSGADVWYWLC